MDAAYSGAETFVIADMKARTYRKIAVFGHFGRGNLGDEATLATVLRNVRKRTPKADVFALTANPEDTEVRHGVRAFPIRRTIRPTSAGASGPAKHVEIAEVRTGTVQHLKRILKSIPLLGAVLCLLRELPAHAVGVIAEASFLLRSSRRLQGTDLFIVAGGGQLGDYFEGVWGYPYTIFKWSLLAKLRGADIVFLSVGAGPLNSRLSQMFLHWALRMARYRSFRDQHSRRLIERLAITRTDNHVAPDMVHGLGAPRLTGECYRSIKVVGINPLPFHDPRYWAEDNNRVYEGYLKTMADFSVWLIEQGYRVVLFPTQVRADPPVINDLSSLVRESLPTLRDEQLVCPWVTSIEDLLKTIDETDAVVASRFHAIVMSLLMHRPLLGLSYDPKSDDLMNDVGLKDFVSDIHRFDFNWLVSRFKRLCREAAEIKRSIANRSAEYRAALDEQYDYLLQAPLPDARAKLADARDAASTTACQSSASSS